MLKADNSKHFNPNGYLNSLLIIDCQKIINTKVKFKLFGF